MDKRAGYEQCRSLALFMSRDSCLRVMQRCHHCVEVEGSRLLARRILHVVFDLGRHDRLALIELRDVIDHPIKVDVRVEIGALERIPTEAKDVRKAQLDHRLCPHLR